MECVSADGMVQFGLVLKYMRNNVMKLWILFKNLPRQLALIGHVVVAFCIKYALSVVKDGLLRKVSSSFFQTYVICDNSYDTVV